MSNVNALVQYESKEGTAYAIRDTEAGLYFIWSYRSYEFAQYMCERIKIGNAEDRLVNWRADIHKCTVSEREGVD